MASLTPSFYRDGALLSVSLLGLVVLVMLPPFVSEAMADLLMAAFAPVCHQLPGRSFHVDGSSFAVCHRCFGAYAGICAGSVAFILTRGNLLSNRRPILVLILAAIPAIIDWTGDVVGIWTNSPISRMSTGAWFGVLAGILLASAVLEQKRAA